jgi:hypothetical protein
MKRITISFTGVQPLRWRTQGHDEGVQNHQALVVGEEPPVLVYLVAENHLLVAAATLQAGSSAHSRLAESAAKTSK